MSQAAGPVLDRLLPAQVAGARAERGRAWLADHGLPSGREEPWRYTPVDELIAALALAAPTADRVDPVTRAIVDDLAGDHGGPRLVCVNGTLVAGLSDLDPDVEGLWLGGADRLRERPRPTGVEEEPADGFHALNWAAGPDVIAVLVGPGAQIEEPVHVVHLSAPGSAPTANHPRTVVRLGPGSRLRLIESYVGRPGHAFTNASTRLVVGEAGALVHDRIQREPDDAHHVGRTAAEVAAGGQLRSSSVMLGARIARSALAVQLLGDGADVRLDGLFAPTGHQHHDTVVTVDHRASHGTSAQRFKGVVDDHARGCFTGHVIVRPGTTGTDASQSNPNLVLRPTARADSRPWLEILADDVRCTHGATVGRLDDDALFYLRSRGIPLDRARAVLVAAFTAEIVDGLSSPSLRDHLNGLLDDRRGAPA